MQRLFISIAAAVATAWGASAADACTARALSEMKRLHPPGHVIYQALAEKRHFTHWITCDDLQTGLATAVHESVHLLSAEWDAYPLIDGRRLPRVQDDAALFAPMDIAAHYPRANMFVETYLRPGQASSADEFGYLLDEMNAYAHDLHAAIALRPLANTSYTVSHRDGLAALMSFVFRYVETARTSHPGTWAVLTKPPVREAVAALWAQSERVMAASCPIPDFGEDAAAFLGPVCRADARSATAAVLGRPPACPVRCVKEKGAQGRTDRGTNPGSDTGG